jgi:hypothetical protein
VLARLPDVSDRLPPVSQPSSRSRKPDVREYRFDPPQGRAALGAGRLDHTKRVPAGESPALPSTNPFVIPAPGWHSSLTPFVRFVMLVVLFTIAGTIILVTGADQQPPAKSQRSNAVLQQSLEPATTSVAPTTSMPVAENPVPSPGLASLQPPLAESAMRDSGGTEAPAQPPDSAGPISNYPSTPFPEVNDVELPSVPLSEPQTQVLESPRAIAKLPGYILEAPTRQANNDDDQSSVY